MHRPGRRIERRRGDGSLAALTLLSIAALVGCGGPAVPSSTSSAAVPATSSTSATPVGSSAGVPSASPAIVPPARLTWFRAGAVTEPGPGAGTPTARAFDIGVQSLEPSIALLPDGTFAFQGWDRPASGAEGTAHVTIGTPGGGMFRDISPTPPEITHDPYLTVDLDSGRIFTANLKVPGELDPTDFCIVVSSSDDRGAHWTSARPVCDPDADRPRLITARPLTSRPSDGRNLVHLCYFHSNAGGQVCVRSLDGGRTFVPSGAIPADGCDPGGAGALFGHLATDPAGTLYLARMSCRTPVVAISRDEGRSWSQHAIGPEGWNGYNEMGVAVDADGVIYGLWVSAERLPWLAASRDGGTTWSRPVLVAPPGVTEVNLPEIAATASGAVAIGMLVSTDAPAGVKPSVALVCNLAPCTEPLFYDAVTWHAALTVTTDGLAAAPLFLTAILNDPTAPIVRGACGPGRCKANADFVDVLIDPAGAPWLAFVACPDGRCPTTPGRGAWGSSAGMLGTIEGLPLR